MTSTSLLVILAISLCLICAGKKTVVITGADRGIGLAATKLLAATNEWNIIAACRSPVKAESSFKREIRDDKQRINIEIRQLDLKDLNSVKFFSEKITKSNLAVDALVCNAGISLSGSGDIPSKTVQGFEETIGVNHIGHFALVKLVLRALERSKDPNPRIVFVGSGVHNPNEKGGSVGSKATLGNMKGLESGFQEDNMVDGGPYDGDKAYKDSKLCNVVTALELSRRLKGSKITSNVMNPGLIPTTGLFRDQNPLFVGIFSFLTRYVFKVAVSEDVGGKRLAFMITDPSLINRSGLYFSGDPAGSDYSPYEPSDEAKNPETGKKLWNLTEKLIKKYL